MSPSPKQIILVTFLVARSTLSCVRSKSQLALSIQARLSSAKTEMGSSMTLRKPRAVWFVQSTRYEQWYVSIGPSGCALTSCQYSWNLTNGFLDD